MAITLNGTTGIVTPKLDALDLELNSVNVVESGSNANGEYIRFADGTQITWGSLSGANSGTAANGSIFSSALGNATFPAAFSVAPKVLGTPEGTVGLAWVAPDGATPMSATTTQANNIRLAFSLSTGRGAMQITAIGRWF